MTTNHQRIKAIKTKNKKCAELRIGAVSRREQNMFFLRLAAILLKKETKKTAVEVVQFRPAKGARFKNKCLSSSRPRWPKSGRLFDAIHNQTTRQVVSKRLGHWSQYERDQVPLLNNSATLFSICTWTWGEGGAIYWGKGAKPRVPSINARLLLSRSQWTGQSDPFVSSIWNREWFP